MRKLWNFSIKQSFGSLSIDPRFNEISTTFTLGITHWNMKYAYYGLDFDVIEWKSHFLQKIIK